MELINNLLLDYSNEIILGAFLLAFFSLLFVLINYLKTRRIVKKYKKLMQGVDGENLELLLTHQLERIGNVDTRIKEVNDSFLKISHQLDGCIQKVGMVRYNPFEQMGGDQSFSIAILNGDDNGFVLTGLFCRGSSSVYAKPIIEMKSNYPLSDEEKQAIEIATKNGKNKKGNYK